MEAYDPYDSIRFHAWNHGLQTFHAIPRMESYDSIHGSAWNHMIPCMERYGTKSKNSKFSKFQIFVLLACHFPVTTGKLCLQFGTESDIFGCDFRFFLDLVPVVRSVILDLILEVLPDVLDLILMLLICNDKRWRLNRNVEWRN